MNLPIDLKVLQSFVAVAEFGNVTRAADALCITQPAVSLRLKQLSAHFDLVLFRRTARGLDLTDDGLALLASAKTVMLSLLELERTAQQLHHQLRGVLWCWQSLNKHNRGICRMHELFALPRFVFVRPCGV